MRIVDSSFEAKILKSPQVMRKLLKKTKKGPNILNECLNCLN